jgi:pyridoxine 5'-phosphate synthase PdxJ
MIDAKTAAEIAKEHGLTLTDAAALQKLADSKEDAEMLASLFADESETDPRKLAQSFPRTGGGR